MVTVTINDNKVLFTINGIHKLWCLKSTIEVSKANIINIYQNIEELNQYKGFRLPGTHLPFVITAGTYIKKSQRYFCDYLHSKKNNTIIVELKNEKYNKLYIQVASAKNTIKELNYS